MGAMKNSSVGVLIRNIMWDIDPLDKYGRVSPEKVVAACGLIPHFLDGADPRDPMAQFSERYQFGAHWDDGPARIDDRGFHTYPEDDDLPPYVVGELREFKIYIMPHALVSVVNTKTGAQAHTRMD